MQTRAIEACLFQVIAVFAISLNLFAQSSAPRIEDEKGFTASTQFQGSSNSLGQVMKWDTSLGYNFNRHFGLDVGVPLYFVRDSGTSGTASSSNSGVGNAYVDLRARFSNPSVNYGTTLTGYAPTGSTSKGFSTGRATFDWNNRFDRSFSRFTPFGEIGIGNTVSDTHFFSRPFTTLGFNTHLEGGGSYELWRSLSVGASGYAVLPSGQQKIFSKLVAQGSSLRAGSGGHNRVFETNAETTGSSALARDDGFSMWADASPARYLNFELGYTRSVRLALNTVSFGVGVNVGKLIRDAKRH